MDGSTAFDQLRSKIEATFGKAMAVMIIASASNATGVSPIGISEGDFLRLAESIARDQRVVDMWGVAGASDAMTQWRQLV